MGTILGVPKIRTIVFWDLYRGPPIFGNYHFSANAAVGMTNAYVRGFKGTMEAVTVKDWVS